jgi:hypothetical protein
MAMQKRWLGPDLPWAPQMAMQKRWLGPDLPRRLRAEA